MADFPRKAESTKDNRGYVLGEFETFLGKKRLEDITQGDVERWMKHLTAKKIEPSSRNRYLGIAKQFCKWMRDELPIPVERDELRAMLQRQRELGHIIDRVERFEEGESSEQAVPPETMGKLLRASERRPDHHRAFVLYGYFGFRRNEGRLLTAKYVDFRRNEIRIRRETTKTPSGVRTIPFHPAMAPYLQGSGPYVLGGEGQRKMRLQRLRTRGGPYVLGGEEPYSKEFFYTFLRGYDKVAGFHLRIKMMRTTFDTYLSQAMEQEFKSRIRAEYICKRLMGHKTKTGASLTEYYIGHEEREEEDKRKAMCKLHWMVREGLVG